MIKLAIDTLGGDRSPEANIDGTLSALEKLSDLYAVLFGDQNIIKEYLDKKNYDVKRLEIVHAPDVITGEDKPTDAIRLKKESSMMKAISTLRTDDTFGGLVSTGATGALVAASTLRIGRLRHVIRPAFCPVLPTMNGGIVGICDSGANVDITPEHLMQFSVMASMYLESVFGVESPRVGLLNIGTESEKGDTLRKEAYPMLSENEQINFVGNMESRDLLSGKYDLVVCDGFSGNVLIKSTEGACLEMLKKLKKDINSSLKNKIGALFMKKMFMAEKEFMNYQNYGGSVLLGTVKVIVKGHGSSNAVAFEKCIEQAYKMTGTRLAERTEEKLDEIYNTVDN